MKLSNRPKLASYRVNLGLEILLLTLIFNNKLGITHEDLEIKTQSC